MFGYRKRAFGHAHALLQALRGDLADLASLKQLQKLLLREIIKAETKIRELKAELRAVQGTAGSGSSKRSSYLEKRIEGFRRCAYIWRCFGDAIAFLYMDKFALKHTYYSTGNMNVKQDAGFIAGKEGLANELALLDSVLERGFPALLVDLTNTIRHGDVCLMVASDPYLIEVKVSKKLDSRGKKQKRSLEKLRKFYETDKSDDLRGMPLRRHTHETPERNYVDRINDCIVEAVKSGHMTSQPERGLHYIVLTQAGPGIKEVLDSLDLKSPWVFYLNQIKSARAWSPYLPFTLAIDDKDHLWDFIQGNLFIFVLVELGAFCQIAAERGYEAKFDPNDESFPLRIKVPGLDEMAGVSEHMLARIGMEFTSPEWIVLSSIEGLERSFEAINAEHGDMPSP